MKPPREMQQMKLDRIEELKQIRLELYLNSPDGDINKPNDKVKWYLMITDENGEYYTYEKGLEVFQKIHELLKDHINERYGYDPKLPLNQNEQQL